MSVINQVLKDLDKRQQAEPGSRVRSHYQSDRERAWGWVSALAAGIVLSALLTWWVVAYALTPSATDAGAEPMTPEVMVPSNNTIDTTATELPTPAEPASRPVQTVTVSEPEQAELMPDSEVEQPTETTNNQQQGEQSRGDMRVERVERSASELAAQRLDQAINAMESGQGRKAETLLEEALVLQPDFIDARQQLAAYYYGRGFSGEALRILRDGLAHTPSNIRLLTLSARIYEETGRADDALRMLNRVPTLLPEHNDIVVLRAALANELGQYPSAAEDYRELLTINPNQGIWWLGLALAEEGQGDLAAARLAYQRAAEDTRLDKASRDFARSREEALAAW